MPVFTVKSIDFYNDMLYGECTLIRASAVNCNVTELPVVQCICTKFGDRLVVKSCFTCGWGWEWCVCVCVCVCRVGGGGGVRGIIVFLPFLHCHSLCIWSISISLFLFFLSFHLLYILAFFHLLWEMTQNESQRLTYVSFDKNSIHILKITLRIWSCWSTF